MIDGPKQSGADARGLAKEWLLILLGSLELLVRGVVKWAGGSAEHFVGEHALGVAPPMVLVALAGAMLARHGSTAQLLLRAVAWGGVLACVVLQVLGR